MYIRRFYITIDIKLKLEIRPVSCSMYKNGTNLPTVFFLMSKSKDDQSIQHVYKTAHSETVHYCDAFAGTS
jgi:hypothetical protein